MERSAFENFEIELNELTPEVREKVLEIASQLVIEKNLSEQDALKEAIKLAEEWFFDLEG